MSERALSVALKISIGSLLLIIAVGSALLFVFIPRWVKGKVVEVPNVIGKPREIAEAELKRAGLRMVVASERFSNIVPEGCVIDQSPRAGMKMKLGNEVGVVLSLGRDKVSVPDLVGLMLDEAEKQLSALDLRVGLRDRVYSEKPRGTIIAQNPLPSSVALRGDPVDLLISDGPYPELMILKDLRGLKLEEAERLIKLSGLEVGELRFVKSRERPHETVVDQKPKPGEIVKAGDKVDLVVSVRERRAARARPVVIRHVVSPDKKGPVHVRIVVEHAKGIERVVDGQFKPGERIERLFFVVGSAKMRVYEDDMEHPVREEPVR